MSEWIILPEGPKIYCDAGNTSDGYHTFNELYDHRFALFAVLMLLNKSMSWKSRRHHDGDGYVGWFIAGIDLPGGPVTYHLPDRLWDRLSGIQTLETAPPWDGHTSADVHKRLWHWAKQL